MQKQSITETKDLNISEVEIMGGDNLEDIDLGNVDILRFSLKNSSRTFIK